jgi:glycosyltransferase involved in cell wall biosynthesis
MSEAEATAARTRVLIDGRFLGKPGGFGRFMQEYCRALGSAPRDDLAFDVAVRKQVDQSELPFYPNVTWHKLPDANFILWEQVMIPYLAHRLGCRVIHFPYNTRALFTWGRPAVVTVHDIIFLTEDMQNQDLRYRFANYYIKLMFRLGTRKARAVVTISNTVRTALADIGVRATTVYNTVDGFIAKAPARLPSKTKTYIVHRGGHGIHRNTAGVISAFRHARAKLPGISLKIFGTPEGAKIWQTEGDDRIEFLPRLTDDEVAALYQDSACVVAASLQEGFCLPIIEGFGLGAPVIASNVDPMREIAGDAALLFDPLDVEAMANAMVSVLTTPGLAESLVAKGRLRLATFSGQQVVDGMRQIYHSCLDTNKKAFLDAAVT